MKDEMKQHEQRLKEISDRIMETASSESAPEGFTNRVMANIEALGSSPLLHHQPLISKWMWSVIVLVIAALCTLVAVLPGESSFLTGLKMPEIGFAAPGIELPSTLLTGLFFFAVFIAIQAVVLKRFADRRFSA